MELAGHPIVRHIYDQSRSSTDSCPHGLRAGGNNRARTYDPLLVRQMLSQLSYASIIAQLLPCDSSIISQTNLFVNTFFEKFFYFLSNIKHVKKSIFRKGKMLFSSSFKFYKHINSALQRLTERLYLVLGVMRAKTYPDSRICLLL